jgi:hypothetical protein
MRMGLDEILEAVGLSDRARIVTCAMVLNRLIQPKSEHAMPDWIRQTALDDILGVDFTTLADDALYRNLDRLHPNRVAIETALVERERTLFNLDQTVYLYDLTSTYFEGMAMANPKAKRGYSRDKRPDCKQVVVGLAINRDGFPIAHEVFEGNMGDNRSLGPMLDGMDRRAPLQAGQTVVVDRGMAFDDNLEEIRSRQLHYIVASRQAERDQWLGVPPLGGDRAVPSGQGNPHVLGNGPRRPMYAPGRDRRPAHGHWIGAPDPEGIDPRARTRGDLQTAGSPLRSDPAQEVVDAGCGRGRTHRME